MYQDILQKAGVPEKSAKIYLAALSLGTATVQEIAIKAEMKRPTVYIHIEELEKEGLIEKSRSGKKDYYRATDPKVLEKRAEDRFTSLKMIVPALEGMRGTVGGKPQVSVLEGREALKSVYRDIAKANSICFWADLQAVEEYFSQSFLHIAESIRKNSIRTREILPDTTEARKSSKRYSVTAGPTYNSRIATKGTILDDGAIYDDTIAIFRLHQHNFFVVVIKEPSIATTIKSLFDMAWDSAEPFIGR